MQPGQMEPNTNLRVPGWKWEHAHSTGTHPHMHSWSFNSRNVHLGSFCASDFIRNAEADAAFAAPWQEIPRVCSLLVYTVVSS